MIYVGIDPGAKGAYAILDGPKVLAGPLGSEPGHTLLLEVSTYIMNNQGDEKVVCELPSGLPGEAAKTAFALGRSTGEVLGALQALGLSYETVRPQKWTGQLCLSGKTSWYWAADRVKMVQDRLGTEAAELCYGPRGGFLPDICDALLIAIWAREYCK